MKTGAKALAFLLCLLAAPAMAADKKLAPATEVSKVSEENRQFIKSVQDMLVRADCLLKSEADGRLGGRTKDALRQFQKQNGLPADGRLTPETFELLAQKTRK